MKHYCGGEIIYLREEGIWYCQNCGIKFITLDEFKEDNYINTLSEEC